ncbi:MAG TPA: Ig-like domain-containing protein [Planctomycetota bacterium]|nr:Ig-like domain-containing protein [Planctomycetota bacterium]
MVSAKSIRYAAVLCTLAFWASCTPGGGGDSGGAPAPVLPPFTVNTVFPAADSVNVSRTQGLNVVFTRTVDPDSITSTTFTLESASGLVPGAVAGFSNVATFTLQSPLAPLTTYVATLTKDVRALSGKTLGQDYTWTFTTLDRTWSTPLPLEGEAGSVSDHGLASNRVGDAVAFWRQTVNGEQGVYLFPFTPQDDWSGPFKLDPAGGGLAYAPQVSIDDSGAIVAIWRETGATATSLWSRRYLPGSGWENAEELSSITSAFDGIDLALGPTGLGYVIYLRQGVVGNSGDVFRSHDPQTGWGDEQLPGQIAQADAAVTNASGRTVHAASYYNPATGSGNAISRTYDPGVGWSTWTLGPGFSQPNIVLSTIDDAGNTILLWEQNANNGLKAIVWNRYSWGDAWSGTTAITSPTTGARAPAIGGIGSGRTLIAWEQGESGQNTSIRFVVFDPATSFSTPSPLNDAPVNAESGASVSMDSQGRTLVAWTEHQFPWIVRSRHFDPSTGWSTPITVASDPQQASFDSKICLFPDGRAVAVTLRGNSTPFDLVFSLLE